MTLIYLIRHGQSKGNKHYQQTGQPIVGAGELGMDSSEVGKEQIKETLEKLKHLEIVAIYSSDMIRTHESALIVASHFNLPVTTTSRLREHHINEETQEQGANRLKDYLSEIETKHADKKVLVVTHGALMRMFLISLGFARNEDELPGGTVENGAFVKLILNNGDIEIKDTYKVSKVASLIN